jgi:hypothetical protein
MAVRGFQRSTGTLWFDSGYVPNHLTQLVVQARVNLVAGTEGSSNPIVSCRFHATSYYYYIDSYRYNFRFWRGEKSATAASDAYLGKTVGLTCGPDGASINGSNVSTALSTALDSSITLDIFAINTMAGPGVSIAKSGYVDIYRIEAYENGVCKLDLIPTAAGFTDRVSGNAITPAAGTSNYMEETADWEEVEAWKLAPYQQFDAANAYKVTDSTINAGDAFEIEFDGTMPTTALQRAISNNISGPFYLIQRLADGHIVFAGGGSSSNVLYVSNIDANRHVYKVTGDGTGLTKAFIDGVQVGSDWQTTLVAGASQFTVGAGTTGTGGATQLFRGRWYGGSITINGQRIELIPTETGITNTTVWVGTTTYGKDAERVVPWGLDANSNPVQLRAYRLA